MNEATSCPVTTYFPLIKKICVHSLMDQQRLFLHLLYLSMRDALVGAGSRPVCGLNTYSFTLLRRLSLLKIHVDKKNSSKLFFSLK